jgi:2-methylcitrate dehydratase PrpD
VLDWLGALLAGTGAGAVEPIVDLVLAQGGEGEATVVGWDRRLPLPEAVFANAVVSRALEIDDAHDTAHIHPGVMIHPVGFGAAEIDPGMSGADLLTLLVTGYEISLRIGLAPRMGTAINGMSFHATGAFGVVGALGAQMQLSREQIRAGMGIAYVQVAGNQQGAAEGKMTVRMQTGFMARAGVMATRFAANGVTGPEHVLEGRYGYYKLYHHDDYERERILDGLGERYETDGVHIKPYPTCMYGHPPIEAAVQLSKDLGVEPEQIAAVRVRSNQEHFNIMCTPIEEKRRPADGVAAQFSTPYAVAYSLVHGKMWLEALHDEALADERVLDLAARVEPIVDEEIEAIDSRRVRPPASVEVELADGSTHRRTIELPRGHPERPMSFDEVADKYRMCAMSARVEISESAVEETIEAVRDLERSENPSEILAMAVGDASRASA